MTKESDDRRPIGPVEVHDLRWSVWADTGAASGVGWFRIADNLRAGAAEMLVKVLSVPAEILPAHATGADVARKLYPHLAAECR